MTIKILASLAIAASLFTACSETTTPPPTKADQCAAGLSTDCLIGTWSINGPTVAKTVGNDVVYVIDQSHNLSASPATLKFYIDPQKKTNMFEFTNSSLSRADCITPTGKTYGTWDILGTSIHLYAKIGNECMEKSDVTLPAVVAVEAGKVSMTLQGLFFMEPEMKQADLVDKQNTTEVYTFVSAD